MATTNFFDFSFITINPTLNNPVDINILANITNTLISWVEEQFFSYIKLRENIRDNIELTNYENIPDKLDISQFLIIRTIPNELNTLIIITLDYSNKWQDILERFLLIDRIKEKKIRQIYTDSLTDLTTDLQSNKYDNLILALVQSVWNSPKKINNGMQWSQDKLYLSIYGSNYNSIQVLESDSTDHIIINYSEE